jgi:prevent-host-death family protein
MLRSEPVSPSANLTRLTWSDTIYVVAETVTVSEAKTQLSQLIERVAHGEEIVIRRGKAPVARLVGYLAPQVPRKPGGLRGQIWMSDDFDEPDEEIERLFGMRD